MKNLLSLFNISAILAALLLSACNSSDSGDVESFSVKFSLASVQKDLTLDSLEVNITLGDSGSTPQAFTIDLVKGTSNAQVMAYPGQKYKLSFDLWASGFKIGEGDTSGTLDKDMNIKLDVDWDEDNVWIVKEMRAIGDRLPVLLEPALGLALAGKPIEFKLDSAHGYNYAWYVRKGDSVLASGTGTKVSYTPADSLAGSTFNLKLVVKKGGVVVEERDWDVKVVGSLSKGRLAGIVTKTDTTASYGTYTRFRYNGDGKYDSVLYYDDTAFVPGRKPVSGVSYTYTNGNPSLAVRWADNESDIDTNFSYDNNGRLTAIMVTHRSGTTVDSLSYPSEKAVVMRSFAQGKIMREVRHLKVSETAEVDSIYSRGDSGLVLTGLIKYDLEGGKVKRKRLSRMFEELTPFAGEWNLYNLLGLLAYRKHFEDGDTLVLGKTECYYYRDNGMLDRVITRDELTGDLEKAEYYRYESVAAAKSGAGSRILVQASARQVENRDRILGLSEIARLFPTRMIPSTR